MTINFKVPTIDSSAPSLVALQHPTFLSCEQGGRKFSIAPVFVKNGDDVRAGIYVMITDAPIAVLAFDDTAKELADAGLDLVVAQNMLRTILHDMYVTSKPYREEQRMLAGNCIKH